MHHGTSLRRAQACFSSALQHLKPIMSSWIEHVYVISVFNNTDTITRQDLGLTWCSDVAEHVAITFVQQEQVINTDCHSSITKFIPVNSNPDLIVFSLGYWLQWCFRSCPRMDFPQEKIPPAC